MRDEYYKQLNAALGHEFDLFAVQHPEWMAQHVPRGATVVLQTDDTDFNAWARRIAAEGRSSGNTDHPLVLIHIRELRPATSRIVKLDAELVSR